MDGVLSQEEINALLNSADIATNEVLSDSEKDTIGEIANISMGTAATTLFSLVNRKVEISTPVVTTVKWEDVVKSYDAPCVFISIKYTVGLNGSNILVLREQDVKIITDLMMGGDGTNTDGELGELHLSAISEAMNQMMGSSATSLSSMLNKMIDISPPVADLIDLQSGIDEAEIADFLTESFVKISFKMEIGDLVDSEIMQLYPVSLAKEMCKSITETMTKDVEETPGATQASAQPASAPAPAPPQPEPQPQQAMAGQPMMGQPMMGQPMMAQPMMGQPMMGQPMMGQPMMGQPMMGQPMDMSSMYANQQINVQPAQFQAFSGDVNGIFQKENIDLIMDVPLDVTVELGRTTKSIQEILDFAPGTIIELNKIAGEPIDVLVNGKYVAKGEVVVIEESFGVRITEIIK
ncbi:MAG: flagellar motor switch phosphatase FliY [Lachnospiraceae bacterium]|nr:flagellar motor switch phosphatase FliY [Lachnospiraceae bacterium]